jgi:hypothetical protein
MATPTQRIADGSALVGAICTIAIQLRAWVAASWFVRTGASVTSGLATVMKASLLAEGVRANVYWLRNSALYRWLTTEPEAEVVVIDLRETYTVGPLVALLDRLVPVFGQIWHGSYTHRLVEAFRTGSSGAWITDSRTVQLLADALEPPDAPGEGRQE